MAGSTIVRYYEAFESGDQNLDTLFCDFIIINNKQQRRRLRRKLAAAKRCIYAQNMSDSRRLVNRQTQEICSPGGLECAVTRVQNTSSHRRSMSLVQSASALYGRRRQLDVVAHGCQLTVVTVHDQRAARHLLTPQLQRVSLCTRDYVK